MTNGEIISIIAVPVIGAFIGWFTNYIAVKMLFHPREERRFFGVRVQGIFPKRQKLLAERLGDVVAEQLFSMDEVKSRVNHEAVSAEILKVLDSYLDKALWDRLPQAIPMLSMFMTPQLAQTIKGALNQDIGPMVEQVLDSVGSKLGEVVDIRTIVREKVERFSSDRIEEILFSIMQSEFKFIELVGGVLGFLIGIIQVLVARIAV